MISQEMANQGKSVRGKATGDPVSNAGVERWWRDGAAEVVGVEMVGWIDGGGCGDGGVERWWRWWEVWSKGKD